MYGSQMPQTAYCRNIIAESRTGTPRDGPTVLTDSDGLITAGSDIDAAVLAVNSDANAPVYAAAVTDAQSGNKYLVFSSRTTGAAASAFTASASSIVEDGSRAVDGLDAQYSLDGGPVKTSATPVRRCRAERRSSGEEAPTAETDALLVGIGRLGTHPYIGKVICLPSGEQEKNAYHGYHRYQIIHNK